VDFGFGIDRFEEDFDMDDVQISVGTPYYMAPEVIRDTCLTSKSDMWSTGVMIYAMLVAYPPFHSRLGMEATFDLIQRIDYDFPEEDWDEISDDAKDLIEKLLVPDIEKRLTAA
jgi:calcium-dependent protein kinase